MPRNIIRERYLCFGIYAQEHYPRKVLVFWHICPETLSEKVLAFGASMRG
jgi:hypothetical protein